METSANTVLVIDDNRVIRKVASTMLAKRGYTVELAEGGVVGLERAAEVMPQVILLDVMMPDMDGYEVCRQLKADEKTRDIPIIMVTSNSEQLDKIMALELGAADYVIKPFDHGELLARVATQVKMKNLIDELEEKNRILQESVKKDGLTNLYNHRYFHERISDEYNRARRYGYCLSCVMMDIDHFKHINDTYGHQAGDEILKSLSGILASGIRDVDIAARCGGEEFALILPYTTCEGAVTLAERIRCRVATGTFTFQEVTIPVTLSAGVASTGENATNTYAELIRLADNALYDAKHSGRNRIVASDAVAGSGGQEDVVGPTCAESQEC